MTKLVGCYQGSVNRWECDENDHLNVRFFMEKSMQTLYLGLTDLGLIKPGQQINRKIRSQHMRFVAEARAAAPISGFIGLLETHKNHILVLTELRHGKTKRVLMTVVHNLALPAAIGNIETVDLPTHARNRGLPDAVSPYSKLQLDEARKRGFIIAGRGVVQRSECENGELAWHQYMGRVSDSVPNFWAQIAPPDDQNSEAARQGRVVLEYRMDCSGILRQGERFVIVMGLDEVGQKTQKLVHLIFNLETQSCVVSCLAVNIMINLATRKAEEPPARHGQQMRAHLLAK